MDLTVHFTIKSSDSTKSLGQVGDGGTLLDKSPEGDACSRALSP